MEDYLQRTACLKETLHLIQDIYKQDLLSTSSGCLGWEQKELGFLKPSVKTLRLFDKERHHLDSSNILYLSETIDSLESSESRRHARSEELASKRRTVDLAIQASETNVAPKSDQSATVSTWKSNRLDMVTRELERVETREQAIKRYLIRTQNFCDMIKGYAHRQPLVNWIQEQVPLIKAEVASATASIVVAPSSSNVPASVKAEQQGIMSMRLSPQTTAHTKKRASPGAEVKLQVSRKSRKARATASRVESLEQGRVGVEVVNNTQSTKARGTSPAVEQAVQQPRRSARHEEGRAREDICKERSTKEGPTKDGCGKEDFAKEDIFGGWPSKYTAKAHYEILQKRQKTENPQQKIVKPHGTIIVLP
ncbi:hypothetical protein EJ05DRAFT_500525 [Pseudovirgaria hyperparasitica]|uniref:Uncharacterized protein n=1 Tax=Pseudovirgaria hyperparasitica TaxID=470096 RepID=A0A6A6W8U7_9PEZI|nr:uncharacterized protein EJ05DRAFT_500525 [Pseudovirgaria hyperparasitica]KAF2758007.1 hypothetical protein EJ05DRAFT_500525 [Pseudovirgaria hyperparasitica]